tara:strand:+ start:954 stop:1781 length:828 start_codon:yes stop_codon:yes gene_type:complete
MKKTIEVYDDLIDDETHAKVYEWCQSVSWYTRWLGLQDVKGKQFKPINEYIPSEDGNYNTKHVLGNRQDFQAMLELLRFTMYRHPIGWSDESTKERNPLIYDLWTRINNHVFDGNATLDGIPEPAAGLRGAKHFYKNREDFYEKYDAPQDVREFTAYLNARSTEQLGGDMVGGRVGQIHKDTDGSYEGDNYFTVLYIANYKWIPDWGGELIYYGDEETGGKHWKRGWDIGWPVKIVGNKPNRVVVYKHNQTHSTQSPRSNAPEMTQKIAFRIKVN